MDSVPFQFLSLSSANDVRYVRLGSEGSNATSKSLPKLLFIHGCPGSIEDSIPVMKKLCNRFEVIAVDRPGFGETKCLNYQTNFEGSAAFIRDVVDRLKISPVVIIGHSYGGCIALQLGDSLPSLKAIVLIGTPIYTFFGTRYLPSASLLLLTALKKLGFLARFPVLYMNPVAMKGMRDNLPRYFSPGFLDPQAGEKCLTLWTRTGTMKRMTEELGSLIQDFRILKGKTDKARLPCLVINGDGEDDSMKKQGVRFCELSNSRTALLIEQSYHYPHVEHPEKVAFAITKFVEG